MKQSPISILDKGAIEDSSPVTEMSLLLSLPQEQAFSPNGSILPNKTLGFYSDF